MDYQLLLDLYETNNITKAAQRHFLSQPAMTKRIKRMEGELGCALVLRNQKGVVFTPVGEKMIPYCRQMCETDLAMRNAVNQNLGLIGGSLNISVSHNFAHYRLPNVLTRYHTQFPEVAVNISTGKSSYIYSKLLQDKLRIAIVRGDYKWTSGRALLSAEPMCLVTSSSNADRPLNDYPYIGHYSDPTVSARMDRWAEERQLTLSSTMWIDDINGCKEMVRRGLGWSLLPRICLEDFDGNIKNLSFEDGSKFTRNTYALYWDSYTELQQVQLFLQVLKESELEYANQI